MLPKGTRPLVPVVDGLDVRRTKKLVLLSASGGEETTGRHPRSGSGLFSHFIFAGLNGAADLNGDGMITVGELHGYAARQVANEAKRENRDQTPQLHPPAAGVDPGLILLRR